MKQLFYLLCLLMVAELSAQKSDGPIIEGYGQVWAIDDVDYQTDTEREYRVIFDIYGSDDVHDQVNVQLNTIARFLNMHAQAGVPADQLHVAAVIHNKASTEILRDEYYKAKYGTDNPNRPLINQLLDNGVQLYFCGQSSRSRDIPKDQIIDGIELSLSAMTVLVEFGNEGYTVIKF